MNQPIFQVKYSRSINLPFSLYILSGQQPVRSTFFFSAKKEKKFVKRLNKETTICRDARGTRKKNRDFSFLNDDPLEVFFFPSKEHFSLS